MEIKKFINDELVNEATAYVFNLLDIRLSKDLLYHSTDHTKNVLRNVEAISTHNKLSQNDINLLKIGAIFHDVGFIEIYRGHEEKSVEYAQKFLHKKNISNDLIQRISQMILATKVPQDPHDLLSDILCDADLMNMAKPAKYLEDVELLRLEWQLCGLGNYNREEFYQITLDFFKTHHYHTKYGQRILKQKKEETEKLLLKELGKN